MNILSKFHRIISLGQLFQPLDWVVFVLAVLMVVGSVALWVETTPGLHVQIYQEGQLYQEVDLAVEKMIALKGPLGVTQIEIKRGKARIAGDPSPRQYCVQKGWLQNAGQLAICLPNHTSIMIVGRDHKPLYDSLHY